jgi:hypothetical protein
MVVVPVFAVCSQMKIFFREYTFQITTKNGKLKDESVKNYEILRIIILFIVTWGE